MPTVKITFKTDEKLKTRADKLFAEYGLPLDAALDLFLQHAVREQCVPFDAVRILPPDIANDKELDAASKKLLEQNAEAYEELAK